MPSSWNSDGELRFTRRKSSLLSLTARRRALRRFINMIVNHPVMKDDGALNVFLTHTDFEAWRKRTKVSTEEESASKQLNPAQEMAIPADLEEKLGVLRDRLPSMLASYQKLVILAERSLGRLQAAAADASRFALSTHTVAEEMPTCCYRNTPGGGACSLCSGVARGFGEIGESWTRVAEEGEKRVSTPSQSRAEIAGRRDLAQQH
jgi:sorting nexin-8